MSTFAVLVMGIFVYRLWPEGKLPPNARADKVSVFKSNRELHLIGRGELLKVYEVGLGRVPIGRKSQQGDHKTPEGNYVLDYHNPESRFHRSIHISYPNEEDILHANKLGVSPGGAVMIHGLPRWTSWVGKLHRFFDLSDGCIVVTNEEMDELWEAIPDGTPIEIRP